MNEGAPPELPGGWVWTITSEVCSSVRDGTHDTPLYVEKGVPLITSKNLKENGIDFSNTKNISSDDHEKISIRSGVENGDILFAMIGTIGNPVVVQTERIFSIKNVALFKKNESAIKSQYLKLWLSSSVFNKILEKENFLKGTTQKFIPLEHLRTLPVPLPPLPEQRRIVTKIEELFTKLDAGAEALKITQMQLKRYRQSVLKAACEGKLVLTEAELARAEGREYEHADVLLARILKERREKLSKGGKYREPAAPDTSGLPPLAEGWIWINLGQITWSVRDGPHYSPEYVNDGIPFITGGNVRSNGVDFANAKRITPELHAELSKRCKPEKGDILYTKGGTTGIARVNTYDFEFNVWVHVAVLKLAGPVEPFYIQHALNSRFCYVQSQHFTHGVGNQDLGLTRMVNIVLGLPPLTEQRRIVAEVERRLSVADEVAKTVEQSLAQAQRLRQGILKRAFEGKLVAQDANDEPAGVLLERIREERARMGKGIRKPKAY